ncbi:MAG TPA: efflux RND transporter periplasmic adaptor subunit [Thermoanaerobaculia bacterium]
MNEARSFAAREGEEPARIPRRFLWIIAGAVLLAIVVAVALRPRSTPAVPAARVARRDLVVPILSDGNLEPAAGGECRAPEAAMVAAVLVQEGQRVSRGTALVQLDSPALARSAAAARSEALQLKDERVRTAADVDQQKREVAHRQEVLDGDKRLLDAGAISRAAYETDELAYRQAFDALRSAESRLASLDGDGGGSRSSRLALAESSARELERRVDALSVRAQTDGVVFGLPRKIGETVAEGQVVASVADPEHLRVRARVDQPDLPRIAVGQRFLVTFDGLPERRWQGQVTDVSTGIREAGGREVGEVLGEISDKDRALPPNASVNVQIVAGERKGVLAIPRAALLRDGERRYVYALERGRARRRDVAVGLIGLNDVEVTSGLAENDVVLLPGSVPLADGLAVTSQKTR